jgi:hypothetical protein
MASSSGDQKYHKHFREAVEYPDQNIRNTAPALPATWYIIILSARYFHQTDQKLSFI